MSVVAVLLPDFLLIALGFLLLRALALGEGFWPGLEKLVYFVLFPALLFKVTATSRIDLAAAPAFIGTALAASAAAVAAALALRPLLGLAPAAYASAFQCAFRFNSYIGLAIAGRVYGEPGIAAFALMQAVMAPAVNALAVWALARHGERGIAREIARNPLIVATVAGFGCNLAGLPLPEVAVHTLSLLAQSALPLGLIAVGAGLRLAGLGAAGGTIAGISAIKLVALPAAAFAIGPSLGLSGMMLTVAVVYCALPASPACYILAARMGGDGELVARILAVQIVAAAATLPAWLALLGL
jgi:predicted permease